MGTIVTWPGASGTSYRTELFPIGTQFNAVSGVYILCASTSPDRWTALYVGETQSLYDRLNANPGAHDGIVCASGCGATHIAVMRADGDALRLLVETDLRHSLNPPCNKQSVPAKTIADILG
ncbi:hypothetical protein J2S73_000104 [Amorphus orientalis]|uniref:GIY-YIG nuclease family protein n=1 Tax=Amorphus orientalis TaxID=649198 RepID=A0AAE3VKF7_9HYPH|nr:hypothetical protein [Amorphus orientalis]